ncbi:DUF945 family protein [Psychrobium sp. 1_MG-2023]|uniref:DUF945 family protein n=1 Tax=Psychrobium sp. 1_MG-2023 TaxID=3062624 RepID=UPI000C339E0E|nr:DUF945 family protein [Psychrobium sp. 1_MG-2023]MDP2561676.1 DUF945 family protein [Psychrobium sp. 1_MG-2023]PKF57080.1 hypothetical protein CW748_08305 [Alteromonadales bacterium alter-6D02]
MNNKAILALTVGAAAVLAGSAVVTNSMFKSELDQQLTDLPAGFEVQVIDPVTSILGGRQSYNITMHPEFIEQHLGDVGLYEPINFYINHNYSSSPLTVKSELVLDLTKGDFSKVLEEFPEQAFTHLLTLNTNVFLDSQDAQFVIEPLKLEKDGVTINLGKTTSTISSDIAFTEGKFSFNLDTMNFAKAQDNFAFTSITSQGNFITLGETQVSEDMTFSINGLTLNSELEGVKASIDTFTIASSYLFPNKQHIGLNTKLTINNAEISNNEQAFHITDTLFDLDITDINKAAYVDLLQASQNFAVLSDIEQPILGVLTEGINGSVNALNTTINKVTLSSDGEFKLPGYNGNTLDHQLQQHVMTSFNSTLNLGLTANYATEFNHFAPFVEQMLQQGFIKADDQGNVSTKIKVESGQVLANGQRIR